MGKQPPQRTTTHWTLTGRHRHPHRINRHTGRRAKKTVPEEYIESQLSGFGSIKFTPSSHVYVSMFCLIDAVTLLSAELKFGH